MDERDQLIAEWAAGRREVVASGGFARGVMKRLPGRSMRDEKTLVAGWVPRPALASFCLVAGVAKTLLVFGMTF